MMTAIRNILAATDLSDTALHAVQRGFLIARHTGARLGLLHALGVDVLGPLKEFFGTGTAAAAAAVAEQATAELQRIAGDPAINPGIDAEIRLEEGSPHTVIPASANATRADLVVVGAHGRGVVERLLLGSTASRLLRKAHCPILVVKEPCTGPYRRALLSVDFSPASLQTLAIVRQVAPRADLVLLHIFEVPFEGMLHYAGVSDDLMQRYRSEAHERAMARLHGLAREAGLEATEYTALVVQGDAARMVTLEEEKLACDLVVMGKHGTHVTEELLLGSVTSRVLARSRADVLVVVDSRPPPADSLLPETPGQPAAPES